MRALFLLFRQGGGEGAGAAQECKSWAPLSFFFFPAIVQVLVCHPLMARCGGGEKRGENIVMGGGGKREGPSSLFSKVTEG